MEVPIQPNLVAGQVTHAQRSQTIQPARPAHETGIFRVRRLHQGAGRRVRMPLVRIRALAARRTEAEAQLPSR